MGVEIGDVEVIEGDYEVERPTIFLDAEAAAKALRQGDLEELVGKALHALELSGRLFVYVQGYE